MEDFLNSLTYLCKMMTRGYLNIKSGSFFRQEGTSMNKLSDLRRRFVRHYIIDLVKFDTKLKIEDEEIRERFPFLDNKTIFQLLTMTETKYYYIIYKHILFNISE